MKQLIYLLLVMVCLSCQSQVKKTEETPKKQPNILWIVTEDISPTLSFYGDKTAKTPHLDALAKESLIYDNAYSVVGVCAPSRSAIITGMYPTTLGTMHMRTGRDIQSWGTREYANKSDVLDLEGHSIIEYAAVIPDYVKGFPEYLRKAGYFTSNHQKTDYQFAIPVTVWSQNSNKAHWRNREKDQPFFSVFNFDVTHESKIWKNSDLPLTVNPDSVPLPPYYQDTKTARIDVARNYSNIELLDKQVGKLIAELKEDGLYDNTIIFFYSDHGGPLPRQKRDIHESGLHVPFMVKDLKGTTGRADRLISFVDLAPTILSLAGVTIPETIQGKAFMGESDTEPRDYVFGTSDRFDEITDRSRAIYDKQYVYVMNDFPEKTWYKDISYRLQIPMMKEMIALRDENKLNKVQSTWFQTKQSEELFDVKKDPHRLHNLADKPEYAVIKQRLHDALLSFRNTHPDLGMMPESQLIETMWPNYEQPVTANVTSKIKETSQGKQVTLSTKTKGASIAYILSDTPLKSIDFDSGWQVYNDPVLVQKGQYLYLMAQRIGFRESEITTLEIN
ncbi:sulfatase family protein [Siansivirga zeaxanthinifaciens]|uniref:Sulfatase n=1 Tax=Siansivirga zeaxanthinifaciens CC-SAMT-1 TaxID=1454006 RepID=A0A0C5WBT1_9FLAO|nr:sulfatase [Siansivirga zeaxanthinifaciens]AJR03732.1 sulfatase [Siansivirga zeaxanthinifaciens CC-SAMT-1]